MKYNKNLQTFTITGQSINYFFMQILSSVLIKSFFFKINNAGLMKNNQERTKQGFEVTYATNHLGHFLLTNMLLGK